MLLTLSTMAITSGVLYSAAKTAAERKKKKERPWTFAAEKLRKKKNKAKGQRINLDKLLAPLLGRQRQQLEEITGQKYEMSAEEKRMHRSLTIASVNIGIAGMSLFYHPLIWLVVPGLLYTWAPFHRLVYQSVKKRRVSSYVLDLIILDGMLLGGYFYAAVVDSIMQTTGRILLIKSENNSKQNLMNLFSNQPRTVFVVTDDEVELEIPFEELQVDDIIIISAGQMIPVDGIITAGSASIDQHKLTGESQLAEKGIGEEVFASTVILAGRIYIQTKKTGASTVAMQIGEILNKTASFKNSIQSRSEVITDRLTLPTVGMSVFLFYFLSPSSGLAVLTNTFGYKMRLFGPASMLSFLNIASQEGILIKDGRSLELLSEIDTIVFDKTGTLTLEVPTVSKIHTYHGMSELELLKYAGAAEDGQSHPIAKAILAYATKQGVEWPKTLNIRYEVGYGIQVDLPDRVIRVGSHKFMLMQGISIPTEIENVQNTSHQQGNSVVMVASDEKLVGAIELQATIRPESKRIINELRQRNMSIVIISGDHEAPTKRLAQTLGVDNYFANTLPENKAYLVEKLQKEGRSICFVGDGINDSIALKKANVSVSLRGATTIATDSAQIVLMDGTLNQLCNMFDIVPDFEANMRNNLLISTIPSAVCIGGVLFFHWGVFTGIVISAGVLLTGIANSSLPLLKYQRNRQATRQSS